MIGHNNPPKDRTFKKRWAMALFSHPTKPTGAVSMGFKLYIEMDSSGCGAIISDREFSDCCGVSERACQNFKRWLLTNGFVRIHLKGGRGRSNAFVAIIPDDELTAPIAVNQDETPAHIAGTIDDQRHTLPANTNGSTAPDATIRQLTAPIAGNPCGASRALVPARIESPSEILTLQFEEVKGSEDNPLPPKGGPSPKDALTAFEAYNDLALRCRLQQASKFTPGRQRAIMARLKVYGLEGWNQALANIEKSAFLQGENERGFKANLDFMCQAKSFDKLHDGVYGNGAHAEPKETEFEKLGRWIKEADERQQQRRIT